MTKHAIKIEDLDIKVEYADSIVETLKEFATDIGFGKDRISNLDCRSCDGFSPYSHNKGGIGCVSFQFQYNLYTCGSSGFKNTDDTISKYHEYDVERFAEENKLSKDQGTWSDSQIEAFDLYCMEDSEATVCLGMDIMLNSESELNIRITVSAKDAPYHRQYDDLIDIDITFKSIAGLKRRLAAILKRKDVNKFSKLLREAW